ncbi:hypothetical protein [Nocardioides ochotonae]|uniref:hypothetical protein n=1 Tax=Nocardioides ochotonae TaxID=2685869 RepID=UPI0014079490|nr:hypothetical protein [Nocardioides ochotonae]
MSKPIEPYRFANGEPWRGPTRVPVAVPGSSSVRRGGDFAARSRAVRALAAADPTWQRRAPAQRRRLIDLYLAEEARS